MIFVYFLFLTFYFVSWYNNRMEREKKPSRFTVPIFIFFVLLVMSEYFWHDYNSIKNKTALIQKEKSGLLDTGEEQKTSLEEYAKNLAKLEKENSVLTEEFASTTLRLQFVETEILKYETEIVSLASSTEIEIAKNNFGSHDLDSVKISSPSL